MASSHSYVLLSRWVFDFLLLQPSVYISRRPILRFRDNHSCQPLRSVVNNLHTPTLREKEWP